MKGNPVNCESYNVKNLKLDEPLERYLNLVNGNNVLDLGIGQGKCSVPLARQSFNVTGVDLSNTALEACKDIPNLTFVQDDIRNFKIEMNKYNLIISRCLLHFLHKDDVHEIIKKIKDGLCSGGMVYLSVFSIADPGFKKHAINSDFDKLDNNIFYKRSENTYMSYFTKKEILDLFADFKTIMVSDEFSLDLSHGKPHYHGIIKYLGRKE